MCRIWTSPRHTTRSGNPHKRSSLPGCESYFRFVLLASERSASLKPRFARHFWTTWKGSPKYVWLPTFCFFFASHGGNGLTFSALLKAMEGVIHFLPGFDRCAFLRSNPKSDVSKLCRPDNTASPGWNFFKCWVRFCCCFFYYCCFSFAFSLTQCTRSNVTQKHRSIWNTSWPPSGAAGAWCCSINWAMRSVSEISSRSHY